MSDIIRIIIGLVIAGLLLAQARRTSTQVHRRRAFELAGGAVLLLTGYNSAVAAGMGVGPLAWALMAVTAALFLGALASLVLAWHSGEERQQHSKFRDAMREKIEERERSVDERRTTNDKGQ
jgi:membrane protein implicated in regulation of membrane protease activity